MIEKANNCECGNGVLLWVNRFGVYSIKCPACGSEGTKSNNPNASKDNRKAVAIYNWNNKETILQPKPIEEMSIGTKALVEEPVEEKKKTKKRTSVKVKKENKDS